MFYSFQSPNNDVFYELIGNTKALQFFNVDRSSGVISVKADLSDDVDSTPIYNVSVWLKFCHLEKG